MALKKVGVEFVTENKQPFLRSIDEGNSAIRTFGDTATAAGPRFSGFREIVVGGLREMGAMAVNFAADAGRALIGLGKDTIDVAGNYESTLNRFTSVTGSSITDAGFTVDQFSQKFLKLGADTQFSAQQAADAGVALAKGGVPIEQIMGDATDATLALAAAGELELAPAAEIVAKQLGVWSDKGVTATNVADLLAQAANASTVDVDELALGLANVGGTAKVAGVSFKDTVQTMALLAPGFSSAADAGTSFKTFLSRLIPQTKDATGMMIDLGLYMEETGSVFYDATGTFIGMESASQKLYEATKDLSEEQKLLAFQTIFGQDAIRAAAMIAEGGAASFNKMGDSMANAGTSAAQAAERNKGYKFALESLKGSFETIQIVVGTAVLPLLTDLINNVLIPGANAVMTFATNLTSAADPFDYLAGAVGRALAHFGPFGTTLQNLINIFIRGQDTLANWEFLERSLNAAFDQLLAFGGRVGAWILTSIPGWVADFGGLIGGFAVVIVDHIPEIMTGLGNVLIAMGNWVTANAPIWGQNLLIFGQYAVSWISDKLPMLGEELGKFFNRMVNWVVEKLPIWGAELAKLGEQAIQWVTDALPGLGTNLGTMAGVLLRWIGQTIIDVGPKLVELGNTFLNWIVTDVIPQLPGVAAGIWTALNEFINSMIRAAIPELGKLADEFYNWIPDVAIPKLKTGLALIWSDIAAWVTTTVRDIPAKTKEIGTAMINGMIEGVKNAAGRLYEATVGAVLGAVSGSADAIESRSPSRLTYRLIGEPIMQGATNAISDGAPGLKAALTGALGGAISAGQAIASQGSAAILGTLGSIAPSARIAAEAQGYSVQPVRPASAIYNQSTTTNTGPSITYNPTYNSPAPPPAMSYATLNALAGAV